MVLAPVTLEPLRAALLASAREQAAGVLADAEAAVEAELAAARADADALVERARADARQRADLEHRHVVAARRREAQARVLRARREAREALHDEVLRAAGSLRDDPAYAVLLDRLEDDARARLGPGAAIERDPPGLGGVIARAGRRVIDATLPVLAERELDGLGEEIDALWA